MPRYRLTQIKTEIDESAEALPAKIAKLAGIEEADIREWEIRRKSIDSRKKPHIQFVYTADFVTDNNINVKRNRNLSRVSDEEGAAKASAPLARTPRTRPTVVGTGPAGLFAALTLARAGLRPLIIERGPKMSERIEACERFKSARVLDPEANLLFGEGGAGTFSDGKLGTGIKDSLVRDVLAEFRDAGAGSEIMYLAKPHIGTDVLREVIVIIRKKIESLGGEFMFGTRLDGIETDGGKLRAVLLQSSSGCDEDSAADIAAGPRRIETEMLVLAAGHSARDTFAMLRDAGLAMEQKPFSIGVRIEHPQALIDAAQYGKENLGRVRDAKEAEKTPGALPPADYKINYKSSNGRGVYSFCMCPGGEVVVCSNSPSEICVNGMSNRRRDSGTANSGILCDVRTEDFGSDDVLAGVRFQEKYERLAFKNGGADYEPPLCSMEEFISGSAESDTVTGSLPSFAVDAIREAIPQFAKKLQDYDYPAARISAVETRSSSPVRIIRDSEGESNIKGIFPAGEGAGYAGGITSAACDGIRAAMHIISQL